MPVVGAPLAGGPSTAELAAAVSGAGGLGFLAAGYRTAEELERELGRVRALTSRPFGVNLFYPARDEVDDAAVAAYAERLRAEGERYGVEPGEPRWSDDDWDAKLELVAREPPAVVSFTFGCPDSEIVESIRAAGSAAWCTVTSAAEAEAATAAGVDALVVQGGEAGGHQGCFRDDGEEPLSVLALLQQVARVTDRPLVAAGGIATGAAVAAVLAAGAEAAQVGSAFLLAPEAGTSEPHRSALRSGRPTRLTRAFTGRRARAIVNRFMRDHDAEAPAGYPQVHFVTAPIRTAARAAGDPEAINLWAGQAYTLAREEPAGVVVERLIAELNAAV
ncbi:MAG TPA: nitronate monooxygenase [Gaiellaceae bacterium]|nr:nitronate monooxygenase [Gaiellaceae bacterium]